MTLRTPQLHGASRTNEPEHVRLLPAIRTREKRRRHEAAILNRTDDAGRFALKDRRDLVKRHHERPRRVVADAEVGSHETRSSSSGHAISDTRTPKNSAIARFCSDVGSMYPCSNCQIRV